jgi:hypothetical protein
VLLALLGGGIDAIHVARHLVDRGRLIVELGQRVGGQLANLMHEHDSLGRRLHIDLFQQLETLLQLSTSSGYYY